MQIKPRDICFSNSLAYFKFARRYTCCANLLTYPSLVGKRPGTYPEYANGCNFCTNTLAYAKFGNGFVQHAYFLTNLKYANKLPRHMSCGYIRTCPPCTHKTTVTYNPQYSPQSGFWESPLLSLAKSSGSLQTLSKGGSKAHAHYYFR